MSIWLPQLDPAAGPRYRAIADAIGQAIRTGELQTDQKLPTHRALADALGVTTGTITRAYAEAERRGLVYGVVGSGTFVRGAESGASEWQFLESADEGLIELNLNVPLQQDRAEMLAEAMQRLAAHPADINRLLDYQPDIGVAAHRQVIAEWLARPEWQPTSEQLVITNGGQHGLLVALMALTRAGDKVVTEALTYPGFTAVTRQLKLQVQPVAMDEEGIVPLSLENACRQHAPRVLFCTPTLQNPTTATMSLERREAILAICQRYGVTVIEDHVCAGLGCDHPLPLAALAPEQVVHVGSFSKVLAAGVRVGYLVVPQTLQARFGGAVRASCWMVSPLMAAVVCEWLRSGEAARFMTRQYAEMEWRRLRALALLADYPLRSHAGGMHLWLSLPEPWRAETFVDAAKAQGVLVMGAAMFAVSRQDRTHAIRISISPPRDRILLEQGLAILSGLLQRGDDPLTLIV